MVLVALAFEMSSNMLDDCYSRKHVAIFDAAVVAVVVIEFEY